jgi:aldehyde dehydrogenase (NAD+)
MNANYLRFFIDGGWVDPVTHDTLDVTDPASEHVFAKVSAGSKADVARAVAAAKAAFPNYATSRKDERLALLQRILSEYDQRAEDLARAMTNEMGAPIKFSRDAQVSSGRAQLEALIEGLGRLDFAMKRGTSLITLEPIGVCALITPWNWPVNQVICKVPAALAAGCTVVLKPSEVSPLSAIIFAEIMQAAGVPKGVFNLVNGTGPLVGQELASHPDVDMVSFTGSTRAGILVAKAAADTVKRVAQELGGKSPNLILHDADFDRAVTEGVNLCMMNSGQNCDAPTRMLVPEKRIAEAFSIARRIAESQVVGNPQSELTALGPLVNRAQFERVQRYIEIGIQEGATLVAGGLGRPDHLGRGYFVKPTVFGHVRPGMRIEREEIFGPVLSIIAYSDEEEAIRIANDTLYGLAAYVSSTDISHARSVASRLRAGQVHINYPAWDLLVPFGGFKQSGNGREYGDWAIREYLEHKGIIGYEPKP